jgi:hypothetical protein
MWVTASNRLKQRHGVAELRHNLGGACHKPCVLAPCVPLLRNACLGHGAYRGSLGV